MNGLAAGNQLSNISETAKCYRSSMNVASKRNLLNVCLKLKFMLNLYRLSKICSTQDILSGRRLVLVRFHVTLSVHISLTVCQYGNPHISHLDSTARVNYCVFLATAVAH